jgi:thioredoxin-related protein
MKRVLIPVVLLPFFLTAQEKIPVDGKGDGGVHFEEGLSWQQVKEKAKAENKFIFVDCFATWCGPCKMMDEKVYSMDSVGDIINKSFVSVRMQCDTSKIDDKAVKVWYEDAHQIGLDYTITAYPTYLFFSPEGQIVHKGLGYHPPRDFVTLAMDAMNPNKQYYTLLGNYQNGIKEYMVMPYLAGIAKSLKEDNLSQMIAADYVHNFLDKLDKRTYCTRENFDLMGSYAQVLSSKDRFFDWCYHHPEKVDTIMHDKGYSDRLVNLIVNKEEILPILSASKKSGVTPDWDIISKRIKHKFGSAYVEKNVSVMKISWYRKAKDWKNYTKSMVEKFDYEKVQQNPPKDFWGLAILNSCAWDIFRYSDDKQQLEKALSWSNLVITEMMPKSGSNYGEFIDTQANLLYKLGKKEKALALEAKAAVLTPDDKGVQEAYQKMQKGKPTW